MTSPRSGPPAVEAIGLGWTYAGRPRPALADITFRLEPGRTLLVLGPSGSGKSTLARALTGLVPHTLPGIWQGVLRIGEMNVASTPARFLGERVGLVFQDPDCQLVMARVDDEVAFGLENRGWPRADMQARVPIALGQVGLAGFESRATGTLSGGEKQRLAIADVLAAEPSLLVFDEPTANLDPPGMYDTLEQLAALARRRQHTIVLIEHRLEAALPLADDVLLIDDEGRQMAFAPADSVGRDAVDLLERSGAWVPRAWEGADMTGRGAGAGGAGAGGAGAAIAKPPSMSSGAPVLLRAVDLGVDYTIESGVHSAVDGLSIEARAGERIAIVGPNGSGKSTLLFALCGLRRPNRGSVGLRALPAAGEAEATEKFRDPARLRSNEIAVRIGLVFQDPELGFVARTARDEVAASELAAQDRNQDRDPQGRTAVGRRRTSAGPGSVPPDADGVLAQFGLGHLADQDPFRLSQGEQRRLSLAALALRPPAVVLLDEPTFGLDRRGTGAVMTLLDAMRATGQTQLLATHDPRLLPHCDRVVALEHGRVVFDGSPDRFLAEPPYTPAAPWRAGVATETATEPAPEPAAGQTR